MKRTSFHLLVILPLLLQLVLHVSWVKVHAQPLDDYSPSELATGDSILDDTDLGLTATSNNEDDDEYEVDDDEVDDDYTDDQLVTHYDIDEDGYYGLGRQVNDEEQGDDLGEEQFSEEDDDEDDDDILNEQGDLSDSNNKDDLLFEDDEAPLDFKNNQDIDLDQLLFDASQKDHTDDHDDIEQLLAHADDALDVDPDDDDDGHPDHVTTTDTTFQEQQQSLPLLPPPGLFTADDIPNTDQDSSTSSHYKLSLFGILVILILLYKVSHKSQGGLPNKLQPKDEKKGLLPIHVKDLNTQDYPIKSPIFVTSPVSATTEQQQQQPATAESQQHGRRLSSSSMSSGRTSSISGVAAVGGGHTRRISLGLPHSIKESIWEEEWDKRKQ
ncbi:hypothetical protein BC941DRAFT_419968 [Chlamydoabsidia padenii]|nr:hypothetical protein BC941DRAFT_419968 [Chlamydoabsidia padenii]